MTVNQLDQILDRIQNKNLPPVHQWNPPLTGEMDMRIASDGSWYYQGSVIHRKPMVKLFSTILRKDLDDYFLVTPVEKYRVEVEDAPFVAVEVNRVDNNPQALLFRTNVDDEVIADVDHQVVVNIEYETSEPRPYLHVRDGLNALIHRNVFYQLVDWAYEQVIDGKSYLVIKSRSQAFELGRL